MRNLKQAAAILERAWAEQPNHPGVVHYLIHSYDVPELAQEGLAAARRYAAIAPAVPHAQHMPSHIFTRLGLWQEFDRVQTSSAMPPRRRTPRRPLAPGGYDQETVHTLDYLAYAYLQTAQDRAAKGVVDEIASLKVRQTPNLPIAYAIAAIPARYALERRDWAAAAALTRTAANFPWDRFPWAAAMTSFARALGAAHGGDLATARAEIAKLQGFRDALSAAKNQYWANQVEVQRLGAAAVLAHVEGDSTRAAELSRTATELEASMDKHPATPGMLFPAHELLRRSAACAGGRRGSSRGVPKGASDRPEPLPKRARHGSCRETCWRHRGGCGVVPSGHLARHESGHRPARARRGQALPDAIGSEFSDGKACWGLSVYLT